MIKPITKDYFFKVVGDSAKYRIVSMKTPTSFDVGGWYHRKNPDPIPWDNNDGYLYFEKPGEGLFVATVDARVCILIIPESYPNLTIEEDEQVDYSDWNYVYLGPPDPVYTLNTLRRMSGWCSNCCRDIIKEILNGDYIIENKTIGFSQKVTIKVDMGSWSTDFLVGFPELLETPYNYTKVHKIGKTIKNYILWSLKN